MDLQEKWDKAVKETRISKVRLRTLLAFENTELPYISLAKSAVNIGDTVVRKGKVMAHKPTIILPGNFPQFEGFDFDEDYEVDENEVARFLLMRGVSFPTLKYNNETHTVDVFEGSLDKAVGYFSRQLERKEDVHCGLILGPEDCWQFSVLIYVGALAIKSASSDVEKLFEYFKKHGHW